MKSRFLKFLFLAVLLCGFANIADAQKKKSTKKTTKTKTKANIQPAIASADTTAAVVVAAPPAPANDSLPLRPIKMSLRPDEAVETSGLRDKTPLAYENLRADDAVYRHRIWREIDTREKMNLPFMYAADADNGNQRFIYILMQALQDSTKNITAFSNIDDRFTTPLTKSEMVKSIVGEAIDVAVQDSNGVVVGSKKMFNEINPDSFYRFHIKEEVLFDKESSRLFWRILGIAPVKDVITSAGVNLGPSELFWIYYPDMRPIFAMYEVYNSKNFGGRMSWEDLFESRMFSGRIIKSSMDNPRDLKIEQFPGMNDKDNPTHLKLRLLESENITEKIFTYEQDLWAY